MRIGAHVSTSGGVDKGIDRAFDLGAETIQVFSGAPQAWKRKTYKAEEVADYKKEGRGDRHRARVHPRPLPDELASQNPDQLAKSYEAIVAEMQAASLIGAKGSHLPPG